jgi:hypothetical protein
MKPIACFLYEETIGENPMISQHDPVELVAVLSMVWTVGGGMELRMRIATRYLAAGLRARVPRLTLQRKSDVSSSPRRVPLFPSSHLLCMKRPDSRA